MLNQCYSSVVSCKILSKYRHMCLQASCPVCMRMTEGKVVERVTPRFVTTCWVTTVVAALCIPTQKQDLSRWSKDAIQVFLAVLLNNSAITLNRRCLSQKTFNCVTKVSTQLQSLWVCGLLWPQKSTSNNSAHHVCTDAYGQTQGSL